MTIVLRAGLLGLLSLSSLSARAAELPTLGTRLPLPFDYKVLEKRDRSGRNLGLSVRQGHTLQITSGPHAGKQVVVEVSYYSPDKLEAGEMQSLVRDEFAKSAGKSGTREIKPLQLDGFGFHFIDGHIDEKDELPERMSLAGVVSGTLYRITVSTRDPAVLSPELGNALKSLKLDYAALLKLKPAFEEEAKVAVRGLAIDTPLQRLTLPSNTKAALRSSTVVTNVDGQPIRRERAFSFYRDGLWEPTFVEAEFICGGEAIDSGVRRYDGFLSMVEEQQLEHGTDRYTQVTAPEPARLLGMQAQTATAVGPALNEARSTLINRWAVREGGNVWMIDINRLNGMSIVKSMMSQLANAPAECQLGLQYGAAPMVGAAAP